MVKALTPLIKKLDEQFGRGAGALEPRWREIVGDRLAGAAVERVVDGPGRGLGPAAADGQVVLAEMFGHQAAAQGRGGVAVEGQQQAAAGGAVEPVHQEDRLAELLA